MTTISKLKSAPAALLVVAGLAYFGVLALFTAQFVAMGLSGALSLFLIGFIVVWIVSARLLRAWAGLGASGFLHDFRGLYIEGGRLIFVAPWVRSFALSEIEAVGAAKLPPFPQPFFELSIRNGAKWRVPGFLLVEGAEAAAADVRARL
ncbi:hypothetical protein [Phenylobacterium immobile]|uniref:hypothetical protein n=1 Tax=Phenylobacterium immobile TaxID=21 RepID=UPI000A6FE24F|nr:hypothetical protein [Phenylobacterium immobile]